MSNPEVSTSPFRQNTVTLDGLRAESVSQGKCETLFLSLNVMYVQYVFDLFLYEQCNYSLE